MSKPRSYPPDSRRHFIGQVAGGLAGTLAAPSSVLGASERVRLGVIGAGDRGQQLAREALACSNTEVVAFADVYSRRREESARVAAQAKTYSDYRALLDDRNVDAVIVATPQHLHAEQFVDALAAGKHVYQEKTMAFTVEQAKRMRAAYKNAHGLAVQIGHQWCSSGLALDARRFADSGKLGRVTAIQAGMFWNTPHGKPHWARPVYPDMTAERVDWQAFLGEAAAREFDANRYLNWRLFSDYSGGSVHENLSQQLAFWYKVLAIEAPRAVTMTGGIYLWKDGREVPDTMSVSMEHSEEMLFTWTSGFGNNHPGTTEDVLGTDGTLSRGQRLRFIPQRVNQPNGKELVGQAGTTPNAHMRNFLDAIRLGREPECPFEIGYRVSIACRMAVDSYILGRTVYWDPVKEEIV